MRLFAKENTEFVIGQTVSAQISWSHNVLLLDKCKDQEERLWYAKKSLEFGWSVRMLEHQIEYKQYEIRQSMNIPDDVLLQDYNIFKKFLKCFL